MSEFLVPPPDRDRLLARIAAHAAGAMAGVHAPEAAEAQARLAAFDAGASAMPAYDLYACLRQGEHAVARERPALARRLRRLGRLVERLD